MVSEPKLLASEMVDEARFSELCQKVTAMADNQEDNKRKIEALAKNLDELTEVVAGLLTRFPAPASPTHAIESGISSNSPRKVVLEPKPPNLAVSENLMEDSGLLTEMRLEMGDVVQKNEGTVQVKLRDELIVMKGLPTSVVRHMFDEMSEPEQHPKQAVLKVVEMGVSFDPGGNQAIVDEAPLHAVLPQVFDEMPGAQGGDILDVLNVSTTALSLIDGIQAKENYLTGTNTHSLMELGNCIARSRYFKSDDKYAGNVACGVSRISRYVSDDGMETLGFDPGGQQSRKLIEHRLDEFSYQGTLLKFDAPIEASCLLMNSMPNAKPLIYENCSVQSLNFHPLESADVCAHWKPKVDFAGAFTIEPGGEYFRKSIEPFIQEFQSDTTDYKCQVDILCFDSAGVKSANAQCITHLLKGMCRDLCYCFGAQGKVSLQCNIEPGGHYFEMVFDPGGSALMYATRINLPGINFEQDYWRALEVSDLMGNKLSLLSENISIELIQLLNEFITQKKTRIDHLEVLLCFDHREDDHHLSWNWNYPHSAEGCLFDCTESFYAMCLNNGGEFRLLSVVIHFGSIINEPVGAELGIANIYVQRAILLKLSAGQDELKFVAVEHDYWEALKDVLLTLSTSGDVLKLDAAGMPYRNGDLDSETLEKLHSQPLATQLAHFTATSYVVFGPEPERLHKDHEGCLLLLLKRNQLLTIANYCVEILIFDPGGEKIMIADHVIYLSNGCDLSSDFIKVDVPLEFYESGLTSSAKIDRAVASSLSSLLATGAMTIVVILELVAWEFGLRLTFYPSGGCSRFIKIWTLIELILEDKDPLKREVMMQNFPFLWFILVYLVYLLMNPVLTGSPKLFY